MAVKCLKVEHMQAVDCQYKCWNIAVLDNIFMISRQTLYDTHQFNSRFTE